MISKYDTVSLYNTAVAWPEVAFSRFDSLSIFSWLIILSPSIIRLPLGQRLLSRGSMLSLFFSNHYTVAFYNTAASDQAVAVLQRETGLYVRKYTERIDPRESNLYNTAAAWPEATFSRIDSPSIFFLIITLPLYNTAAAWPEVSFSRIDSLSIFSLIIILSFSIKLWPLGQRLLSRGTILPWIFLLS